MPLEFGQSQFRLKCSVGVSRPQVATRPSLQSSDFSSHLVDYPGGYNYRGVVTDSTTYS
jgi:hypothetical protein